MSLIDSANSVHTSYARPENCDAMVWLRAQAGRDEMEVRRELIQHPGWSPVFSIEAIVKAGTSLAGAERAEAQGIYAGHIIQSSDEDVKKYARVQMATHWVRVDPEVLGSMQAWLDL